MVDTRPQAQAEPGDSSKPDIRRANLRTVDVNQQLHHAFAEKYGFVDNEGKSDVAAALSQLDNTFFKSDIEKGRKISNYHRTQVITVSAETELNPFNAEIYGIFTPFGDLKVMATMDGWLKIATSEPITKREFTYSETTVSVEIHGKKYNVPEWIECYIEHKEKGSSHAREYFQEVFDNGQNHLPSWSRPARMLSHVVFIQALRRLLRISSLADSDIIADITKEYEALVTQAKYEASIDDAAAAENSQPSATKATHSSHTTTFKANSIEENKPRGLNIKLEDVEVADIDEVGSQKSGDTESKETETPQVKEVTNDSEPEVSAAEAEVIAESPEQVVSESSKAEEKEANEAQVVSEQKTQEVESPETVEQSVQQPSQEVLQVKQEAINEMTLPRNVLSMFKPMFQQVLNGEKSLQTLIACGKVITDERAKIWFAQQLEELKEKL